MAETNPLERMKNYQDEEMLPAESPLHDETNAHLSKAMMGQINDGVNHHSVNMSTATERLPHDTSNGRNAMSIAICGLAMRLPGSIRDAASFWDLLYNGKDARGPIPPDRYNAKGFNDALSSKGAIKTQHGSFLDEDLARLDTSFFSMTKTELEKVDPQQR